MCVCSMCDCLRVRVCSVPNHNILLSKFIILFVYINSVPKGRAVSITAKPCKVHTCTPYNPPWQVNEWSWRVGTGRVVPSVLDFSSISASRCGTCIAGDGGRRARRWHFRSPHLRTYGSVLAGERMVAVSRDRRQSPFEME